MRENTDQNNSEHGHFLRSVGQIYAVRGIIKNERLRSAPP